jgi:hypothetical protein
MKNFSGEVSIWAIAVRLNDEGTQKVAPDLERHTSKMEES